MTERHRRLGIASILQAALDGFAMAAQELGPVLDATMPEFKGFRGSEETTLTLVERGIGQLHGLFDPRG